MSPTFWQRIHGGSTHFPIVLLLASLVFDFIAWRTREEGLRRGLHAAGFGCALVGMLGGIGAVAAGLIMTHGRTLGGGYERMHHLFVWPAVIFATLAVGWRLIRRGRIPQRGLAVYFAGLGLVSALMLGAGYSGGEMVLGAATADAGAIFPLIPSKSGSASAASDQSAFVAAGQQVFLKNCAHCHGAGARGEDGPDLHKLDLTEEQIAARIRNGKKDRMTAFAGKLSPEEIRNVIAYVRALPE